MQHAEKLEILTFFKFEEDHDILTLWTKLIPNMTKALRKIHFLKKNCLKNCLSVWDRAIFHKWKTGFSPYF